MALRQTEPTVVKVGEREFYITPFPAFKAANLTGELASVLAPLFGIIAPFLEDGENEEGIKKDTLGDVDAGEVAKAMSGCTAISGDKLELLMRKLLLGGNVVVTAEDDTGGVKAQRLNLDLANELFCGDVQDMFVLCFHVIRLNFGGFFRRLAARSGAAKSKEEGKEEKEEEKTPRKIL